MTPTKKTNSTRVTLLLGAALTVMAGAAIAAALPKMHQNFAHLPNARFLVQLSITLPGIFIALFATTAGWLIDKKGRRTVLLPSLLLYGLAGASGFFFNNLYAILISRALLGIAVAGTMTAISTLVGDYYQGKQRSNFLSIQGMFLSIGGIVFVSSGGLLADINWQMPFLVYTVAFGVLALAYFNLPEPSHNNTPTPANTTKTPAPPRWKPFALLVLISTFFSMLMFYFLPIQLPFVLSQFSGIRSGHIGLSIALSSLGAAITAYLYRYAKKVLSYSRIFMVSFGLFSLGYSIIGQSVQLPIILTGVFTAGLGLGFCMPNQTMWLIELTPAHLRGRWQGYLSGFLFAGQFTSPVLINLFSVHQQPQVPFVWGALLLSTAALAMVFVKKPKRA